MNTEMGEYIVGAYLKLINECDFVDYNVRRPRGGLAALNEIDVVGLDFKNKTAYLCEVTTHLDGLLYVDAKTTVERIKRKYDNLKDYGKEHLPEFTPLFMFWSPVVRPKVWEELRKIQGLELVVNDRYSAYVDELLEQASKITYDTNNPSFRVLQIIGHLRRPK